MLPHGEAAPARGTHSVIEALPVIEPVEMTPRVTPLPRFDRLSDRGPLPRFDGLSERGPLPRFDRLSERAA